MMAKFSCCMNITGLIASAAVVVMGCNVGLAKVLGLTVSAWPPGIWF